jgi:hypothetical protein
MLEPLLVADNFNSYYHTILVVKAFESLAETSRAELVQDFEAVSQMVPHHDLVVTTLVVKAKVVA